MPSYDERLARLEAIILNSKNKANLTVATSVGNSDVVYFFSNNTQKTEAVSVSTLFEGILGDWKYIENSFVEKGDGNVSVNTLEADDIVWFKKITNDGDPLTLIGHTYDGGDKQLLSSYSQNQSIAT